MNRFFARFFRNPQLTHKVVHSRLRDYWRVATTDQYTVFMTKGTHVVSADTAEAILDAIRTGKSDVTITLDVYGSRTTSVDMTLITGHVVSLMKHEEREEIDFANVTHLRR
jgi:hypothetical protein